MKLNPNSTLLQRKGIANRMSRLYTSGRNNITPSLLGSVGVGLMCLILCGCITEYEATGIDEDAGILVVEGVITDDETTITLSRSSNLTDDYLTSVSYINDAKVSVECDDGTQFDGYPYSEGVGYHVIWRYLIKTGKLNPERQYSLKIEFEEHEYCSDYAHPIETPEIDSIFWMKRGPRQPVMIYVSTHSPENKVLYYRWSYREDWEIHSTYNMLPDYPHYCWDKANSAGLLLGSAEKTVFGKLSDIIVEILPYARKLSVLYRINVKQNAISKRAYDYFANIRKNDQQSGSIFAPTPSELRGNITCTTDPERPVIGYVDVSTTTQKNLHIYRSNGAYEQPLSNECELVDGSLLLDWNDGILPKDYVLYDHYGNFYAHISCVDCTYHGTEQKPDDWPN